MRAALFAVVLILAGLPTAQGGPVADLSAQSIHAAGNVLLAGPFLGLHSNAPDADNVEALGTFDLEADHIRIETDNEITETMVLGIGITPGAHDRSQRIVYGASLSTIAAAHDAYAFVTPLGAAQATVEAKQATTSAASGASHEYPWVASGRERASIARDESIEFASDQHYRVTVTGPVRLALWGWTMDLSHDGGTETFHAGERRDPEGEPVQRHEARAVYLFVEDGTLTMDVRNPNAANLFLREAQLRNDGETTLHGARGVMRTAGGHQSLDGDTITFDGGTRIDLQGGPQLRAVVRDAPGEANLNGATVALAGPEREWTWFVLGGALLVVVALALPYRRWQLWRAEAALARHRFGQAVVLARKAARRRRLFPVVCPPMRSRFSPWRSCARGAPMLPWRCWMAARRQVMRRCGITCAPAPCTAWGTK
jgi:hypothetical protein